jgi:hypothetical protein
MKNLSPMRKVKNAICIFFLCSSQTHVLGNKPSNLFCLFIGSGNYFTDTLEAGARGFSDLASPAYSAWLMDSTFKCFSSCQTIKLLSNDTLGISKAQIDSALDLLISAAQQKARTTHIPSVILIYYAGHAIQIPTSFDLFLVPAYFPMNVKYAWPADMRSKSYSALALYYKAKRALRDSRIIVLMDCCYNSSRDDYLPLKFNWSSGDFDAMGFQPDITIPIKKGISFRKKKLKKEMDSTDTELSRYFPEDGAFYAAPKGNYASTVPSPVENDSIEVAPICRRTLLILRHLNKLNFDLYFELLTDKQFDSYPPVSYYHLPVRPFKVNLSLAR